MKRLVTLDTAVELPGSAAADYGLCRWPSTAGWAAAAAFCKRHDLAEVLALLQKASFQAAHADGGAPVRLYSQKSDRNFVFGRPPSYGYDRL